MKLRNQFFIGGVVQRKSKIAIILKYVFQLSEKVSPKQRTVIVLKNYFSLTQILWNTV